MAIRTNEGGDFDAVSPVYDGLSFIVFGRKLQRAQAVFLKAIPAHADVLIVGGGTGWLLEQVLTHCRPNRVVYLDTSARMVARASRRILRQAVVGAVDFRVGDETMLTGNDHFDVIITPFVLDLFTEQTLQAQFIPRLRSTLKTGGLWLVTDFIQTTNWWQKLLLRSMIRFFRLTAGIKTQQLSDWQRALAQNGLLRQDQQTQVGGMVSTEIWVNL
ncbi:class I SAM-dependent methyltransferase [Spirosoma sp. KNUC1025]|uniref:class I SAM-dependent methyltransferase n=1 Tax=Spirosoma sp. KNUC1025 TaxID=2894082 RepID=UPI003868141A|nr:class I SAM-dependent methyltransferase [Spirosoma sp. KNUC1025]